MAKKERSEVESFTTDSEPQPLHHLLDLLNPSLSDNHLRCIEYVCEFALGVSKDQIRSEAKDPETRKLILNALFSMLPQDIAPTLLNLILTRLNYKPKNKRIKKQRSKLPAVTPDKVKEIYEQYPKLDMWLTLTIAMTSMSEGNYRVLREHVRLEVLHDSHSNDNIESCCHLLELVNNQPIPDEVNQPRPDEVNPEPVLNPEDLSNVLTWFKDCGLEYPEEIVQYQQRYEIPVPESPRTKPRVIFTCTESLEKCCLCTFFPSLCLSIAAIAAFISILLLVTLPYLSRTVYHSTGNYTSYNYSVGVMRTVKIGDNYSSDVIRKLQIEALNDPNDGQFYANGTEIYKVQQNYFMVSSKELDFISIPYHFYDERPLFLGYNGSGSPFYNADGPANVSFSFMLTNSNGSDCAVRMATFSSRDDYIKYYNSYPTPRDTPQNAYNFTPCLNESGTYHFSLNMARDVFSYFIVSHIMNVRLIINISGYVSEYKIRHSLSSSCILDPSCPGNEDVCTRDNDDDETWYVFGTSASRLRGKVRVSIPLPCYEEYVYHFIYFAPIGPPVVLAVFLIILCIVAFVLWLHKCVSRKLREKNSYNPRRVGVDGTV